MKPYFVELRMTAVVMAESESDAIIEASSLTYDIWSDNDAEVIGAEEVKSLAHLSRLDHKWNGECTPYGQYETDEDKRLNQILPEKDPS